MRLTVFGATDAGRRRDENEDFLLIDPGLGLFAIADGMGGHASGAVAARMALETLRRYVDDRRDKLEGFEATPGQCEHLEGMLSKAIQFASATVYQKALSQTGQHGMGTTCTAVLVVGGKAFMGHVGHSRLYLQRGPRLAQLSEDHTYTNEAVRRGVMTQDEAQQQSNGHSLVITRAVGTQRSVCVDTLAFDLLPDDTLLLCTDGLTHYVQDEVELRGLLASDDISTLPETLIALANDRGGADNVSALTLRALPERGQTNAEAQRSMEIRMSLDALRFIGLFQDLTMAELVRVYNAFRAVSHEEGTIIFREGETSESLYVIVEGAVQVYRKQKPIALLKAGAHFGELALLNLRPRTATVETAADTRLMELTRPRFNELLQQNPGFAAAFLWKLAQSLSMRIDDIYEQQDQRLLSRETMPLYGIPSPFKRPHG